MRDRRRPSIRLTLEPHADARAVAGAPDGRALCGRASVLARVLLST